MKKDILKKIGLLVSSNGISLIFPVLFAPILSRIYSAEEFGIYAMFTTVVGLAALISSFRYDFLLYRYVLNKYIIKSYYIALIIVFCFFIIISIISIILFFTNTIMIWYLLIPVSVFLSGFIQLNLTLANVFEKYKLISFVSVLRSISINILMLLFGLISSNFKFLIICFILTQLLQSLFLLISLNKLKKSINISYTEFVFFIKKHFNELKHSVLSTLTNSLSIQLPILYMKNYFSYNDVGNYFQSDRLVTIPVKIVSRSLSTVYIKEVSKIKDDKNKVSILTLDFIKKMVLVGVIPFSVLFVFGKELFLFLLGPDWSSAGIFIVILSPYVYINFLVIPLINLFEIYSLQKKLLGFNTSLLVFRALALAFGAYYDSLILGIIIFSAASILNYVLMLSYLIHYVKANLFKVLLIILGSFISLSVIIYLIKILLV